MRSLTKIEKTLLDVLSLGYGLHCPYKNSCLLKEKSWFDQSGQDTDSSYLCLTNTSRCRLIRVIELLADSYLRRGEVYEPPVPPKLIDFADTERKVQVQLLPLKAHHGGLWFFGDEWLVQLNAKESEEEKRYTMFHEAFHIMCYNVSPSFRRSDQAKPLRRPFYELLADYFAICVLMPRNWIFKLWPTIRDVEEMAHLFGVTKTLMSSRLVKLGLLQAAGEKS